MTNTNQGASTMNITKRSEVEVTITCLDNATIVQEALFTTFAAPVACGVWERCFVSGNDEFSACIKFTEADEAMLVMALTKYFAALRAMRLRSPQHGKKLRRTRSLLEQVQGAIDAKWLAAVTAVSA